MSVATQDSAFIQGSPEWLSFRKKKIGGSDAPIIMGISPWMTPYRLWMEKLDLTPSRTATNAMNRGIEMEKVARESFCEKIGKKVEPRVLIHHDFSWMMASLDGIDSEGKTAVEIKCPLNEKDLNTAKEGKVPEKYYPQLQHQMEVSNLESIYYYSFDGTSGHEVLVERDDKYIKKMLKEEQDFYECMMTLVSPKLTDQDYENREDLEWAALISQWKPIRDQLIFFETQEKQLREQIIACSGGKNIRGAGVKLTRFIRKGAIDYSKIPELKNIDTEKYRKESSECFKITDVQTS